MSKIQWGQLHSELFGRRHITLQPHGLFALAKHLFDAVKGASYPTSNVGRTCTLATVCNGLQE